jgi:hypothetical protein
MFSRRDRSRLTLQARNSMSDLFKFGVVATCTFPADYKSVAFERVPRQLKKAADEFCNDVRIEDLTTPHTGRTYYVPGGQTRAYGAHLKSYVAGGGNLRALNLAMLGAHTRGIRSVERGRATYQASRPGETPARATGRLLAGIGTSGVVPHPLGWAIGIGTNAVSRDGTPYPAILESITWRSGQRPLWERTAVKPDVRASKLACFAFGALAK